MVNYDKLFGSVIAKYGGDTISKRSQNMLRKVSNIVYRRRHYGRKSRRMPPEYKKKRRSCRGFVKNIAKWKTRAALTNDAKLLKTIRKRLRTQYDRATEYKCGSLIRGYRYV